MRVALAQIDCVLGDVDANLAAAAATVRTAAESGADIVVFPELALHGYTLADVPPGRTLRADDPRLRALSEPGPDVLIAFHENGGVRRYNSAAYVSGGVLRHVHRKLFLPTYGPWEERKHVSPGQVLRAYDTDHGRFATLICADAWQPVVPWLAVQDGAEVLLVTANSAGGTIDTQSYWDDLLRTASRLLQCWVVFVNRVGVEAGAEFWGGSRVFDPGGHLVARAPLKEPDLLLVDIDVTVGRAARHTFSLLSEARLGVIAREVRRLIDEGGDQ